MPEKPPTPPPQRKGGSVTSKSLRIKKPRLDPTDQGKPGQGQVTIPSLNVTSNCQMVRFDADFESANCD